MKASDNRVIELLNEVLTSELTAISQYFVHAEMSDNWGYEHRYEKVRKEAMAEMKHAEKLIERVLFLEGVPNVQRLGTIVIGETVVEQLKADLALEEEEEHINWLEAQLALVDQAGEQNYLAEQIRKEDES